LRRTISTFASTSWNTTMCSTSSGK
jgi:hypothetical protein